MRALLMVAALGATACPQADDEPSEPAWHTSFEGLPGALLSVWGTGADDVWTVGADAGDGPYILTWDGSAWSRTMTAATGDLWWVNANDDVVWACGDAGLVVRIDRAGGEPQVVETPTDLRLYGIFQVSATDVWAVGGDPQAQVGTVMRWDGTAFTEQTIPAEAATVSFFKVWGAASNDVWIVGNGGTALHWDGTALQPAAVPLGRPLLTVHGQGSDVVAVGGFGSGHIVHAEGGALVDETPMDGRIVPQLNGVYAEADEVWAAGTRGAVWKRDAAGWAEVEGTPTINEDYHAIYADPEGGVWAVGGNIISSPLTKGVLAHLGEPAEGGWTP